MTTVRMPTWRIHEGDCRAVLATLPERSVQTCVTSPPYFGLRDYGTVSWDGGDPDCDHKGPPHSTMVGFNARYFGREQTEGWEDKQGELRRPFKDVCGHCGARRVDQQIGLEPTPDEFVGALVAVFREVRRVLRDDGTVWLNLGDSYAATSTFSSPRTMHSEAGWKQAGSRPNVYAGPVAARAATDAKPKDLLMIPALVALALRADGWYLRSEIIWSKPNPMPESVTDRPTTAHEKLYLLAKSGSTLFWTHRDHGRVDEQPAPDYRWVRPETGEERSDPQPPPWRRVNLWRGHDYVYDSSAIREPDSGQDDAHRNVLHGQPGLEPSGGLHAPHRGLRTTNGRNGKGANKRSVWTVATQPYQGAHFAVFPPKLIEPSRSSAEASPTAAAATAKRPCSSPPPAAAAPPPRPSGAMPDRHPRSASPWMVTWRADPAAARLADRHYSRKTVGAGQFSPPGAVVALVTSCGRAVWVTWRTDYAETDWVRDAWVCCLFRNEGAGLSSDLIRAALAITRHEWGNPLPGGTVTFVDPGKLRRKRDPGRCFRRAGFAPDGTTQGGHGRPLLLVLRLPAAAHPDTERPSIRLRPGAHGHHLDAVAGDYVMGLIGHDCPRRSRRLHRELRCPLRRSTRS
jgi:DNA modification methylase